MSSTRYQFSGSAANGDVLSPDMADLYERGYVAFYFYSDAALTNLVTPSAGTVTTVVTELGDIFGSIQNGVTNAAEVGPLVTYLRPNWAGSARTLKLTFAGVTGAAFFKCHIARFGS